MTTSLQRLLPRRAYNNAVDLSIIGFGGILCLGRTARELSSLVGEVIDRGVNYFDVAPSYGEGEAEEKLGPALQPYRENIFLSCKTMQRDRKGAERELQQSLSRLCTDHLDLYQFHAVTTRKEVDELFSKGGALEAVVAARERGAIRYIGFSAHSEVAALSMLDRFPFDSILFPFNVICATAGSFGPRVLEHAKAHGTTRLALKAMALSPWPANADHPYPKCWYRPIDDADLAGMALRFTLGLDLTAAIPPGEEVLFRLALDIATGYRPLDARESEELLQRMSGVVPLFTA
jgi:hypothetical protein